MRMRVDMVVDVPDDASYAEVEDALFECMLESDVITDIEIINMDEV